jgi:hypothetical protein
MVYLCLYKSDAGTTLEYVCLIWNSQMLDNDVKWLHRADQEWGFHFQVPWPETCGKQGLSSRVRNFVKLTHDFNDL